MFLLHGLCCASHSFSTTKNHSVKSGFVASVDLFIRARALLFSAINARFIFFSFFLCKFSICFSATMYFNYLCLISFNLHKLILSLSTRQSHFFFFSMSFFHSGFIPSSYSIQSFAIENSIFQSYQLLFVLLSPLLLQTTIRFEIPTKYILWQCFQVFISLSGDDFVCL